MKQDNLKFLRFNYQSPLLWVLMIFVIIPTKIYSQSHNIYIVNELNEAMSNLKVVINKKTISYTNTAGEIDYLGDLKEIEINQKDYYFKENNISKDGFYKINLIKTKMIEEIIINKKDSIINEYEPKNDKRDFSCSYENKNLSILTSFEIKKNSILLNYSFYISSISKYNKKFNFVVYKKNGNKIDKIYTEKIENYKIKNNTYDFSNRNIKLEKGSYLFGMEWIIEEPKDKYYNKVYNFLEIYGQSLGGSLKKKSITESFFYKDGNLKKIDSKIFQQIKIRL